MSFVVAGKNILWKLANRFLVNPRKTVRVHGNTMRLDETDTLLLSIRRNYEPRHVRLIKATVRPGDVVLDLGAHIGYFTLILADAVGEQGKVYAFEPNPKLYEILKSNVQRNGCRNVVLVPRAVADRTQKVTYYPARENTGNGRIHTPDALEPAGTPIEIESVGLDEYFAGTGVAVSFFKMDIQGAEPLALKGMAALLGNRSIKFTIEFWPQGLREMGHEPRELIETIRAGGFRITDLGHAGWKTDTELIAHYERIKYFTTLFCERD